jgi:hypothetical protein
MFAVMVSLGMEELLFFFFVLSTRCRSSLTAIDGACHAFGTQAIVSIYVSLLDLGLIGVIKRTAILLIDRTTQQGP